MHFLWVLGHRETGVLFVGTRSPCRLAHVVALRRHDIVAAPRPSLAWGERTLRPQGAWVRSSGDNVVLAKPAAPSGGLDGGSGHSHGPRGRSHGERWGSVADHALAWSNVVIKLGSDLRDRGSAPMPLVTT